MALAWYDEIGAGSVFFKDGSWINSNLRREILCDPDAQSPGLTSVEVNTDETVTGFDEGGRQH